MESKLNKGEWVTRRELMCVEFLVNCARPAPSADNSQPWAFRKNEGGLDIIYDGARVAHKTFAAEDPATLIAIGALLENISQGASAAALDVEISLWPEGRAEKEVFARVFIGDGGSETHLAKFGHHPLFDRHTNRFPFSAKLPPEEELWGMTNQSCNQARIAWLSGPDIKSMGSLVGQASEVRFQTSEVHEWLARSLRFDVQDDSVNDGLDVSTLALPPGGSALLKFLSPWPRMRALNRIGAYKLMAAIEAAPVKSAPVLAAIISPSDNDALLSVGMLMERLWIALNAAGLAVHPYYVISDQLHRLTKGTIPAGLEGQVESVDAKCRELLKLQPGEQLQILFRVGYPTREAVRSRRLPAARLIVA